MEQRTAVLIGATGLIGGYCLQSLLESEIYSEIVAFTRRPLECSHPKLKVVLTTFNDVQADAAGIKVDDVFCCLGTTMKRAGSQELFRAIDCTLVVDIARVMRDLGASQIAVVSSIGADEKSKVFYSKTKGEMEVAVVALGFVHTHILRPSLLLGTRQGFRFAEKIGVLLSPIISLLLCGKLKKYRPIHGKRVASFMVNRASVKSSESVSIYESNDIVVD